MKICSIIITVFLFCAPGFTDPVFSPAKELYKLKTMDTVFCKDRMFLSFAPSFSLVSENNDQESTDEGEADKPKGKAGKVFFHITFTYMVPVSYFTTSLILKEFVFTDTRDNNPLIYINPVVTSVATFGTAGFFAGLVAGIVLAEDKGFMNTFVYSTIMGVLLGITGMLGGGIFALLQYDSIVANDLFYYGGPVLFLFIPVFDIIRIIAED